MALGKNKKIVNLVQSISEMKEENYAAGSPELQNVYNRLNDGRHQLAQVYGEDMQAVMAMSDLGLKVGHDMVKMTTAAEDGDAVPEKAVEGLKGWIDCFERAELAGTVFAGGVNDIGEIEGHPALQKAYDMGATI